MENAIKIISGNDVVSGSKKVGNVLWFIFVGLWSGIATAITGAAYCVTLIFIPAGIQMFKMLKLEFLPFDKDVATRFRSHIVLNILWLIFGGLVLGISYYIFSFLISIFIITIPAGVQLRKIGKFLFAPFGAEIVQKGEYTSHHDSAYDAKLVLRHAVANPDVEINTPEGKKLLPQYLKEKKAEIERDIYKIIKHYDILELVLTLSLIALAFIVMEIVQFVKYGHIFVNFSSIVFLTVPFIVPLVILEIVFIKKDRSISRFLNVSQGYANDKEINKKIVKKYFENLWIAYPKESLLTAKERYGDIRQLYLQIHDPLTINKEDKANLAPSNVADEMPGNKEEQTSFDEEPNSLTNAITEVACIESANHKEGPSGDASCESQSEEEQPISEETTIDVFSKTEDSKPPRPESQIKGTKANNSYFEDIKKLKELLDCGAITQEEFESKKKELLDKIG